MPNEVNKSGATDINLFHSNNTESDLSAHLGVCQAGIANNTGRWGWKDKNGVFHSAELHSANLSALSTLDEFAGFLYQISAATFITVPYSAVLTYINNSVLMIPAAPGVTLTVRTAFMQKDDHTITLYKSLDGGSTWEDTNTQEYTF
jgi:hypothetical protein